MSKPSRPPLKKVHKLSRLIPGYYKHILEYEKKTYTLRLYAKTYGFQTFTFIGCYKDAKKWIQSLVKRWTTECPCCSSKQAHRIFK